MTRQLLPRPARFVLPVHPGRGSRAPKSLPLKNYQLPSSHDSRPQPRKGLNLSSIAALAQDWVHGHEQIEQEIILALHEGGVPMVVLHHPEPLGKSTATAAAIHRLNSEEALERAPFWFSGEQAMAVIPTLGKTLVGGDFDASSPDHIFKLSSILRRERHLVVLDHFDHEFGYGAIQPTAASFGDWTGPLLQLLPHLRGGASRFILTCRGEAGWLGPDLATKVVMQPLSKLKAQGVLLAKTARENKPFGFVPSEAAGRFILNDLEGNLVLLFSLQDFLRQAPAPPTAEEQQALEKSHASIFGNLASLDSLPPELRPYLVPLSLCENHADLSLLDVFGIRIPGFQSDLLADLMTWLKAQSLLASVKIRQEDDVVDIPDLYFIPLHLSRHLRDLRLDLEMNEWHTAWEDHFTKGMAAMAELHVSQAPEAQIHFMRYHAENLKQAQQIADRKNLAAAVAALTQFMGRHATLTSQHGLAARHFAELAWYRSQAGDPGGMASAFHHLGLLCQQLYDFSGAEQWHLKALSLDRAVGNLAGAADSCYELSLVADAAMLRDERRYWRQVSFDFFGRVNYVKGQTRCLRQTAAEHMDQQEPTAAAEQLIKALMLAANGGEEDDGWTCAQQLADLLAKTDADAKPRVLSLCTEHLESPLVAWLQNPQSFEQ